MISIYCRARAGLPLIIEGETGCGKSSVLRCLISLLNAKKSNGSRVTLHQLGTSSPTTILFIFL